LKPGDPSVPRSRFASAARTLVYALLPLALLVLVSEGVLRALDWPPAANQSRGFRRDALYIAPDLRTPGGHTTLMHEPERREVAIPPRDERVRIVLLGGSNVNGWNRALLEQHLNQRRRVDARAYEVINLGRAGYGSERISILFEQALALEPELALFYEGHNEFVEAGFRAELEAAWSSPFAREAARHASALRSFRALCTWLEPEQGAAPTPEQWRWEYERYAEYEYADTLVHMQRFERNVEHIVRTGLESGVRMMLVSAIGNMLAAPFSSTLPAATSAADRRKVRELLERARAEFPERYGVLWPREPQERMHWNDYREQRELPADFRMPRLRDPLAFRPGSRPFVFHPRTWSQRAHEFHFMLEQFHARELVAEERAGLERCAAQLEQLLELCPDHPLALFALGLCDYLEGRDESAAQRLRLAARYDRAPRKASDLSNELLRAVAERHPEVVLYDAEPMWREASPSGILGFELLWDECHLHHAAADLLLDQLADKILALGLHARARGATNAAGEAGAGR